jgi:hypothetical protein
MRLSHLFGSLPLSRKSLNDKGLRDPGGDRNPGRVVGGK